VLKKNSIAVSIPAPHMTDRWGMGSKRSFGNGDTFPAGYIFSRHISGESFKKIGEDFNLKSYRSVSNAVTRIKKNAAPIGSRKFMRKFAHPCKKRSIKDLPPHQVSQQDHQAFLGRLSITGGGGYGPPYPE